VVPLSNQVTTLNHKRFKVVRADAQCEGRWAEQLGESALALLGRFPAQVFAAQFEQIKGAQRPPGS